MTEQAPTTVNTVNQSDIYGDIVEYMSEFMAAVEDYARQTGLDDKSIAAAKNYFGTHNGILEAIGLGVAYSEGDWGAVAEQSASIAVSALVAAGIVASAAAAGVEVSALATVAASAYVADKAMDALMPRLKAAYQAGLTDFFEEMGGISGVLDSAYDFWFGSRSWFQRRDPLTLDLDGDGLETVGIDTGRIVYFDHNGDGIKTATGWVGSDDGFLALDRNGNGTIDSGAELFGDSTVLADGSTAADGFSALAEQDSNGDGVVDANDTGWGALRVWRDLNQNGISEAGELQTLNDIGIASLDVGAQSHSQVLADGNRLADLGRFTWATGEVGEIESTTGQSGDIDLAENSFYRQFTDPVPLTAEAQALPEMHGSGALRDMREAAIGYIPPAEAEANYYRHLASQTAIAA